MIRIRFCHYSRAKMQPDRNHAVEAQSFCFGFMLFQQSIRLSCLLSPSRNNFRGPWDKKPCRWGQDVLAVSGRASSNIPGSFASNPVPTFHYRSDHPTVQSSKCPHLHPTTRKLQSFTRPKNPYHKLEALSVPGCLTLEQSGKRLPACVGS